jgi:hypothetical protein
MARDPDHQTPRDVRIDRMIEHYRRLAQRRLLRQAKRLWREAELDRQVTRFERPPERVQ